MSIPLFRKITSKFLLLFLMGVSGPMLLYAQTFPVSGVVTDESKNPMIGVSISVKGTSKGTITDVKGSFSMNDISAKDVLIFSFMGYSKKEIVVGNQRRLNVVLTEDTRTLDEVVVVGYGTQRKSDITGALVSVRPDDMNAIPTSSLAEMLRGQAAGVQITQGSARPGGSSDILIRGKRSLTGGNQPLFIVDGVPVTNIDDFNSQDIKSVEILKDASSQAIYGARASNGVILITTHRGQQGKMEIELNSYLSSQQLKRNFEFYSPEEWADLRREAWRSINNDQYAEDFAVFPEEMLNALNNKQFTDWEDLALDPATMHNHTLSIRKGNESSRFAASMGLYDQTGMVPNSNYQRANVRFNFDQQLTQKLSMGVNFNYTFSNRNAEDGEFSEFITMNPLYRAYDDNGKMVSMTSDGYWNPLWNNANAINNTKSFRMLLNMFADWEIVKGVKYRLNASFNRRESENGTYQNRLHEKGSNLRGSAAISSSYGFEYLLENILTYDQKINETNKFDITLVQSTNQQLDTRNVMSGSGFSSDLLTYNAISAALIPNPVERSITPRNLVSFMGRLRYNLADRYLFSASARVDGSSVFGINNKYGFFPAASFAWRASEEPFLKDIEQISNMKLRLSYGSVGNQAVNPYRSQAVVQSYYMQFGAQEPLVGYLPGTQLWNPDLKWETSTSTNVGFDFGFFDERVSGSVDYYVTNTTDLLMNKSLPPSTGYTTQLVNIGKVQNKGLEIAVSVVPVKKKDFFWSLDFSFSKNNNKIVALDGRVDESGKPMDDLANRWFIGYPMDVYYSYRFDGIWQQSDKDSIPTSHMPTARPGDVRVVDINDDGVINPDDREIKDRTPDWFGSFGSTLKYKGIDFSFDFYTVQGGIRQNAYLYDYNSGGTLQGRLNGLKVDYWTPENPSNTAPRPYENAASPYIESLSYQDGSYIRLRNVMLGYTLPAAILKALQIQKLRVYGSATNLWTKTDFLSYSPESGPNGYPEPQNFTVGLNLSF